MAAVCSVPVGQRRVLPRTARVQYGHAIALQCIKRRRAILCTDLQELWIIVEIAPNFLRDLVGANASIHRGCAPTTSLRRNAILTNPRKQIRGRTPEHKVEDVAASENTKGLAELKAVRKECRSHFRSVAIFSVFVNLLMLTGPLFMLQTYDRVLSSRSEETLVALLLLVTGLFLMMGLLEYARGRVLARAGARFQSMLDMRIFEAVLRRSIAPSPNGPEPNTAARDLDSVRQLLSGPAPFALFDIPWTPIFLGAIFIFHPLLGVIACRRQVRNSDHADAGKPGQVEAAER